MGADGGYACQPRSVTYVFVRSFALQPTVAALHTHLRPWLACAFAVAHMIFVALHTNLLDAVYT